MSSIISSDSSPALVADLTHGLRDRKLTYYTAVASTALILYDWILTSQGESIFVWGRGRSCYVQILFVGARYAALACAILRLFPETTKINTVIVWLRVITIICAEVIFATRTWAIWERSRLILVTLIVLAIACTAIAITLIEFSHSKALETSVTLIIEGVGQYHMQISNNKVAWASMVSIEFLLIFIFQSAVLALTLYGLLRHRRDVPQQSRSTLADILWVDGIMYFVFMFFVGILNVGVTITTSRTHAQISLGQLQTILHSVLSTRIVFHTAKVLRQDIVDSRGTSEQNRQSNSLSFAVAGGTSVELAEVQETRN